MFKHFSRFALAITCCVATWPAAAQAPLKIGFMGTFSGSLAAIGQDQYDGFMLAVEQRGGKLGNAPVQIIKEDDQYKPDVATQIVQKLIEKDRVPIITGITGTSQMIAVAKTVTDKKVFLISTNSGPAILAGERCSPFQFVVSFQVDSLSEVVAKYADEKGYKKVMLLAPNYQGGKDVLNAFKKGFKGTVVDEIYTPLTQLDFSAEITQIGASKPDAVFVFYPAALGVSFVRQYDQAGLLKTLPLLSIGTLDAITLGALQDSALGAVTGMNWAPDIDNAANKKFVEAFEAKYNRIPTNLAAQGYDGALLIDSAVAKVKGNLEDKAAFAAALKAADFKSVGGDFRFNNNNFPIRDYRVFQVAKDAKGRVNLKTVATPLKNHQDPYHTQCKLS